MKYLTIALMKIRKNERKTCVLVMVKTQENMCISYVEPSFIIVYFYFSGPQGSWTVCCLQLNI